VDGEGSVIISTDAGAPPVDVAQLLAFPRRGATADGSWVRQLVVSDLAERGVAVTDGPGGEGLLVTGPAGRAVVDLDAQFPDAASAAARSARLAEGGWLHRVVAVEDVAALRTATAQELQVLVGGTAPARRDPGSRPAGRRAATRGSVPRSQVSVREPAPDESDVGWGPPGEYSSDERLVAERPPHW
jgi:hypothetical protein